MAIQTSADWAALGISKTGMMIGSDAVIGDVKSATVQQYDLNVSAMHFSENTEEHLLQLKPPSILNTLYYSQQLNSSNLVLRFARSFDPYYRLRAVPECSQTLIRISSQSRSPKMATRL
jgi:hypothetical protein